MPNETTGKKPAPKNCTVVIPKGKLPLLLAELAKVGLILPAEYVTAQSFVGMLDSAVLTLIAVDGDGEAATTKFDSFMEDQLRADSTIEEATDMPLRMF